jgi:hypothetical protein
LSHIHNSDAFAGADSLVIVIRRRWRDRGKSAVRYGFDDGVACRSGA